MFCLARHSCTAQAKGDCFKIPFCKGSCLLFSYRSSLKMQTVNQRGWALPPPCFGGSGHGVLAGQQGITHRGTGKEMQQWGEGCTRGKGCTQGLMESSIHPGELYQGLKHGINLARTQPAKILMYNPVFLQYLFFIYFFVAHGSLARRTTRQILYCYSFYRCSSFPRLPWGLLWPFWSFLGAFFWHGRQK